MTAGEKVRALRKALGLVQAQLAERSSGAFTQEEVSKVENGKNKLSTVELQESLAQALGLPFDVFRAYLKGDVDLKAATAAAKGGRSPAVARPGAVVVRVERDPVPAIVAPANASPLVRAVEQAFDNARHTWDDGNAVIAALHEKIDPHVAIEHDLVEKARVWLDAAAALRREDKPVNAVTLLDRVTLGKSPWLAPADDDAFQREIAEVAARHGVVFGQAMAAVEAFRRGGRPAQQHVDESEGGKK